jgi:C1q domain
MSEVVAFSFGKTATQTSTGTIVYDSINVDTHSGYSTTTGQYTVQVEGVYVVSISLASTESKVLNAYNHAIMRLGYNTIASVYVLEAGQDMASQTVLIDAPLGSNVSVYLYNQPAYSDIRYQTAFMGFLYSPTRSLPYAWSVSTEDTYNPIDPVPFDIVFVNRGLGWDTGTYRYTVQASGVYYIHLTAGVFYQGDRVKMDLLVNGVASVNVQRTSTQHAYYDTRGRGIILRLNEGDELRVRCPVVAFTAISTDTLSTAISTDIILLSVKF